MRATCGPSSVTRSLKASVGSCPLRRFTDATGSKLHCVICSEPAPRYHGTVGDRIKSWSCIIMPTSVAQRVKHLSRRFACGGKSLNDGVRPNDADADLPSP